MQARSTQQLRAQPKLGLCQKPRPRVSKRPNRSHRPRPRPERPRTLFISAALDRQRSKRALRLPLRPPEKPAAEIIRPKDYWRRRPQRQKPSSRDSELAGKTGMAWTGLLRWRARVIRPIRRHSSLFFMVARLFVSEMARRSVLSVSGMTKSRRAPNRKCRVSTTPGKIGRERVVIGFLTSPASKGARLDRPRCWSFERSAADVGQPSKFMSYAPGCNLSPLRGFHSCLFTERLFNNCYPEGAFFAPRTLRWLEDLRTSLRQVEVRIATRPCLRHRD